MRTETRRRRQCHENSRKRSQRRAGAVLVEFAIVANIFFLLIFTCVEYARVSMVRNLVQDAAYFSARKAMVPGATEQEAIEEANRVLSLLALRGATVTINGGAGLTDRDGEVSVAVTVPFGQNSLILSRFVGNVNFTATAVMQTERYDGFFDPSQS